MGFKDGVVSLLELVHLSMSPPLFILQMALDQCHHGSSQQLLSSSLLSVVLRAFPHPPLSVGALLRRGVLIRPPTRCLEPTICRLPAVFNTRNNYPLTKPRLLEGLPFQTVFAVTPPVTLLNYVSIPPLHLVRMDQVSTLMVLSAPALVFTMVSNAFRHGLER